jgi:hypothetical protein
MTRRPRRRIATIGVGVSLLTVGITPASAHYVYQPGFGYESSPNALYPNADATVAGTADGAQATDGMINPPLGEVTIAGPDGNPVINPATGQPFLVDLNALNPPPTNVPANAVDVATDLAGDPITVIDHLPTGSDSGAQVAPLDLGSEFYVVPMHVAAAALTGAP